MTRVSAGGKPGERNEWKLLREEAGLTLAQLAARPGVDTGTMSRWERGNGGRTTISTFLNDTAGTHAQTMRMQVYMLQSLRDGWFAAELVFGNLVIMDEHWDVILQEGGLFDRWREIGTLPAWTPRYAGIAA